MTIHVSSKHRVMVTALTGQLATLFPTAPQLDWAGERCIAIPHQLPETLLLRSMGMDAPAPILSQYNWPGLKAPFDAQRQTCALMTTSTAAYVLNGMGCVDADTEYLSPAGWVRIADYAGGPVAQYLPETGAIELVDPTEYVKLPCPEMIRFRTSRGVDQLLSPEHRVLLADGRVLQAEDVEGAYGSRASRDFRFRTTFRVTGPGMDLGDAMIRLQVAVNADGWLPNGGSKVSIRLKKPRKIARLQGLLSSAGVEFTSTRCRTTGFTVFRFTPPMRKGFGAEWWRCSQHQLEIVADEFVHWDGSLRKSGGRSFCSMQKADADFIQFAISAAGERASMAWSAHGGYTVYAKSGRPDVGLFGQDHNGIKQNVWREPSTDGFKYCFMVPSTFLLLRRNGCIFATGNTGKTKCALWSFDFLRSIGLASRMLVVAPLSTLDATWRAEAFSTTPHLKVAVLHGTAAKRLKLLAEPHDVYLINPGGLQVIADALAKRPDINTLTIDELTAFKNATATRSKTMATIAARMKWRWGMTGSPTPQAPTDAWGQCRIITPHTVPKFFGRFREQVMVKVSEFRWVPKRDAADTVFSVMQPAVRFTLDDVAEIPDGVVRPIEVPMGKRQADIYKKMKDHAHAAIEAGDITAANAGAVLSKLLQISMGYVYNSKGETIPLDNETRLDILMSLIADTDQKVIVFSPFKHALHGIHARIKGDGFDVAEVSGDTPAADRGKIFTTFQNTPQIKVLAAHPACMAHGLTLTAASTIVWFGPVADLEIFDQANARIRRVGQKHKQQVFLMQSSPAEKRMYSLLENKQLMQSNVLDLFEADT